MISVALGGAFDDHSYALGLGLLLALVTVAVCRQLSLRRATPVLLHNLSWAGALLVYSLNWIAYVDITTRAWVLLTSGIATFNVGCLVAYRPKEARVRSRDTAGQHHVRSPLTAHLAGWPMTGAFFLGFALYLHAIAVTFGLAALFNDPNGVRAAQGDVGFLGAFPLPARLLYFLGPLLLVGLCNAELVGSPIKKKVRVPLILLIAGALALSLGRTLLLTGIGWELAVLIVRSKDTAPRRFARRKSRRGRRVVAAFGVAIAAVATFQGVAVFTGKSSGGDPRVQAYVRGPLVGSAFTSGYFYATAGLPAWSNLVDGQRREDVGPYYGAAMLSPILKAVPLAKTPNSISPFTPIPFEINVYTWLETFYQDFGDVGVVLMPFIAGLLIGLASRRRATTAAGVLFQSLAVGLLVWVPFINRYVATYTWEWLGILAFVAHSSLARNRRIRRATTSARGPSSEYLIARTSFSQRDARPPARAL